MNIIALTLWKNDHVDASIQVVQNFRSSSSCYVTMMYQSFLLTQKKEQNIWQIRMQKGFSGFVPSSPRRIWNMGKFMCSCMTNDDWIFNLNDIWLPLGSNGKLPGSDSVYTILIRIPGDAEGTKNASIRMIQEPGPLPPLPVHPKAKIMASNPDHQHHHHSQHHGHRPGSPLGATVSTGSSGSGGGPVYGRRTSTAAVGSKLVSKQLTGKGSTTTLTGGGTTVVPVQAKRKKKKNQEKKQEKKAAKTLSAILLAFIMTWTPYNILVLLRTVLSEDDPIPAALWDMAYYLCYINSTINPMCYALCNASFRRTYVRILTCKWDNSRRQAVNRGYYN